MTKRSPYPLIAALCAIQFIDVFGVGNLVPALPAIRADLNLTPTTTSLLAGSYALLFGACLLPAGKLGDVRSPSRVLCLGLLTYIFASLVGIVAGNGPVLIAARGIQGVGAALAAPSGMKILLAVSPPGVVRNRRLGIWTAAGGIGGASGLVVGGLVTDLLTWRAMFALSIPVALVACLVVFGHAPALAPDGNASPLPGALSLAMFLFGIMALLFAVTEAPETHVPRIMSLTLLIVSLTVLVAWNRRDRASPTALVPARVRVETTVRIATLVNVAITFATSSASIFLSLWLQDARGMSATQAGQILLAMTVAVIAGSLFIPRLTSRWPPRGAVLLGLGLLAAGMPVLIVGIAMSSIPVLIIGLGLCGAGLGASSIGATSMGMSSVAERDHGTTSGLLSAAAPLGTAFGIALLSAVVTIGDTAAPHHGLTIALSIIWALLFLIMAIVFRSLAPDNRDIPGYDAPQATRPRNRSAIPL